MIKEANFVNNTHKREVINLEIYAQIRGKGGSKFTFINTHGFLMDTGFLLNRGLWYARGVVMSVRFFRSTKHGNDYIYEMKLNIK